ncbi:MAG: hypothetical protein ACREBE_20480, partial [bacterium]
MSQVCVVGLSPSTLQTASPGELPPQVCVVTAAAQADVHRDSQHSGAVAQMQATTSGVLQPGPVASGLQQSPDEPAGQTAL